MPNLVGTGLNQVPTNSMLGGLAYQDPDHASIKDLDLKNLSQINSEIADTAVDVFIYDTRKDSDGGAWRKKTQNTSWYNETLGTATRGTRKEFPAVAVIVAEYEKLTIYDGDDPDLPMWMIFNYGTNNGSLSGMAMLYSNGKAVFALNGIISSVGSGGWHDGLTEINLLADFSRFRNNANVTDWSGGIGTRNTSGGYGGFYNTSSMYIVNASVNDVAMTVLPNAPIDSATGLPVPTIAIATAGGVSVIRDDGTVVDITNGIGNTEVAFIDGGNRLMISRDTQTSVETGEIPTADIAAGSWRHTYYNDASVVATLGSDNAKKLAENTSVGGNSGLSLIDENLSSATNGLVAYATTSYNTGWMQGDIKGAFLSDTDTTNISGTELITNGTFDSNVNNWGATFATVSHQTDRMRVTNTGTNGWAKQSFSVTSGVKYVATVNLTSLGTASNLILRIGTDGNPDLGTAEATVTTSNNGVHSLTFTASSDTLYFIVRVNGVSGTYLEVDNISVRIAELDRSVNNNGLAVYGTITKSAVATGADLVAYSGFSASNRLESIPTAIDFGSSPNATICFISWVNQSTTGSYSYIISVQDGNSEVGSANPPLGMAVHSSTGNFYMFEGTDVSDSLYPIVDGNWHHCVGIINGTSILGYVDGKEVLNTTTTNSPDLSGVDRFHIGHFRTGTSNMYHQRGSLALSRISKSIPSAARVKKMYEDEKCLFHENAKATLYGSSDAVTALAYDDTTNLLHVGTSAGRSEFQGLRRINNTTTAVTTAISASNGLVTEQ